MKADSHWDVGWLVETPTDPVQRWEAAQALAVKLNADVDLADLRQYSTVMRFEIAGKETRIYTANRLICETFEYQSLSIYTKDFKKSESRLWRKFSSVEKFIDEILVGKANIIERCVARVQEKYLGW